MSADDAVTVPESSLVGVPDVFQRLWTPHRMTYIDAHDDHSSSDEPSVGSADVCPFCAAPAKTDEDGLIVHRGALAYVVLNLFPYNPGHLLLCPYRHIADLTEATGDEIAELMGLAQQAMRVTRAVSGPAGFNLGINQGSVAGAGVAAHLHLHVVPRWQGDANFFPIIARTKSIPQLLADTRARLAEAWGSPAPAEDGHA